ncbi:MAG: hypothetical protein C4527_11585 [Candidatus Omnitrophota bacterium]|jgi:hypothetical protein|nr:MAG: hypothetical protein C4527_11585 [Candidatus Omnitrophota bacterium]
MRRIPCILLVCFLFVPTIAAEEPILTVEAGAYDRIQTIIQAPLDFSKLYPGKDPNKIAINLYDGETVVPAQWIAPVFGETEGKLIFVLGKAIPAGHSRTYKLLTSDRAGAIPCYDLERVEGDHVTVIYKPSKPGLEAGPRKILQYNDGIQKYEPDPDSHLSRSGYVHPLWTPAGRIVTGDRCPDHPHQRGCFFAWTKCTFKGKEVNFWALDTGKSRTVSPPKFTNGPVMAVLQAENELLARDESALRETLTYSIYGGIADGWIIDVFMENQVVNEPLQIEQYSYGGMAYRGPASWLNQELDIVTSEGIMGRGSDLTRAKWIQMNGPAENDPQSARGVVYFDLPSNPRYPTFLRVHPTKPYFAFAYHQREGLFIDQGHPVRLGYRILVHDGLPEKKRLEAMSADLEYPPTVRVSTVK